MPTLVIREYEPGGESHIMALDADQWTLFELMEEMMGARRVLNRPDRTYPARYNTVLAYYPERPVHEIQDWIDLNPEEAERMWGPINQEEYNDE